MTVFVFCVVRVVGWWNGAKIRVGCSHWTLNRIVQFRVQFHVQFHVQNECGKLIYATQPHTKKNAVHTRARVCACVCRCIRMVCRLVHIVRCNGIIFVCVCVCCTPETWWTDKTCARSGARVSHKMWHCKACGLSLTLFRVSAMSMRI